MLFPGEQAEITAMVVTKAPVDVDWVDLTVIGTEYITYGSGNSRMTRSRQICGLRYRLREATRLPEGAIRMPLLLDLPATAPPSYTSSSVTVSYRVKLRVSIPWWPDARAEFMLVVGLPRDHKVPDAKPMLVANNTQGPQERKPYVEASLAGDVIVPGKPILGSVSLGNVASNRYHGLRIRVVGVDQLRFPGYTVKTVRASEAGLAIPVESPSEGQSYPIRFRLLRDTPASHMSALHSLAYHLEISAQRRWASDLTLQIPITVAPSYGDGLRVDIKPATAATGSDRVRAVWQRVADEVGLDFDGERIHGTAHGVGIELSRQLNEDGAPIVAAQLEFPSLNLDLSIQRASFGKSGRKGVQLGDARWDKRHRVTGQLEQQVSAFVAELGAHLTEFNDVSGDDRTLRMTIRNNGTVGQRIASLARQLIALAEAIPAARRQVPPPVPFGDHVTAWQRLASDLTGTLDQIRVDVSGTMEGMTAKVHHAFTPDGEVSRTMLTVSPPSGLHRDQRFYAQRPAAVCDSCGVDYIEETECPSCEQPLPQRAPIHISGMPGLVGEDRQLAHRVSKDAERLSVSTEDVELTLLPQYDPAPLLPRIRQLVRLARALAPGAGPYR